MKDRRAATATRLRRRRDPRSDAHGATGVAAPPSARVAVTPAAPASVARPPARLDAPQDRALYTCGCGFVFQAAVSTSVGCPHCGDHQAW